MTQPQTTQARIQENVPLAPRTTLGVGGAARYFVEASSEEELLAALRFAREQALPVFLLGGGSNLLVSDAGFAGLVIHLAAGETEWLDEGNGSGILTATAGSEWDSIVRLAVAHDAAGIECLAGIPGSAGGTPVQNVGAYGQEVASTIVRVRAIDLAAETAVEFTAAECGFAYRRSMFNSTARGRYAITRVEYRLALGGEPHLVYRDVKQHFVERGIARPTLAETADAVRSIRKAKGMLLATDDPDSRSAGSFFKNPVTASAVLERIAASLHLPIAEIPHWPVAEQGSERAAAQDSAAGMKSVKLSAAWLIERAGFHKGFALGRAGLSTKHVLAVVNRGEATANEVVALRDTIIHEVHARFAIQLEQEPVLLGF